jgi:hypothetical protein
MIVTARQLEDLHRLQGGNGQITLPYRARLTPLAADFIRAGKIALGYSDAEASAPPLAVSQAPTSQPATSPAATFLHWCDGPCGPAKAALSAVAKETTLRALEEPADPRGLVPVIKTLAGEIKSSRASGGILLVRSASAAIVYANRCPSLRAILGTCLDTVEQGLSLVAANVLVLEYPYLTLQQTRNLIGRFVRGPRILGESIRRELAEVASCG